MLDQAVVFDCAYRVNRNGSELKLIGQLDSRTSNLKQFQQAVRAVFIKVVLVNIDIL